MDVVVTCTEYKSHCLLTYVYSQDVRRGGVLGVDLFSGWHTKIIWGLGGDEPSPQKFLVLSPKSG